MPFFLPYSGFYVLIYIFNLVIVKENFKLLMLHPGDKIWVLSVQLVEEQVLGRPQSVTAGSKCWYLDLKWNQCGEGTSWREKPMTCCVEAGICCCC